MKILHTADWHISDFTGPEKDGLNCRTQDTLNCIDAIYKFAVTDTPDIILVSGDIFDAAQVWATRGLAETQQACKILEKMSRLSPVVVLRGTPNHDGEKQFDMLQTYFAGTSNVIIIMEPTVAKIFSKHGEA